MDFLDRVEAASFLGHEFLLWLLHQSSEDRAVFEVADAHVEVLFDDQIVLEAKLSEAEQSRLKGGSPAYSPEAHKALQRGKRIVKARLRLRKTEREWAFHVDADRFLLSGIQLPAVLSNHDEEKFLERMFLIEELEEAWFSVFRLFLETRLGAGWPQELEAMRQRIRAPMDDFTRRDVD